MNLTQSQAREVVRVARLAASANSVRLRYGLFVVVVREGAFRPVDVLGGGVFASESYTSLEHFAREYVAALTHNPYTGQPRDPRDIGSDPCGAMIVEPDPL